MCLTAYAMAERQTLTRRVRGAERQNDKDGKMTCDVTIQVEGPLGTTAVTVGDVEVVAVAVAVVVVAMVTPLSQTCNCVIQTK